VKTWKKAGARAEAGLTESLADRADDAGQVASIKPKMVLGLRRGGGGRLCQCGFARMWRGSRSPSRCLEFDDSKRPAATHISSHRGTTSAFRLALVCAWDHTSSSAR